MVKFATNASGAIWLTIASGILFSWRDNSSFRCFTLDPLCLWQCLLNLCSFSSFFSFFISLSSFSSCRPAFQSRGLYSIFVLLPLCLHFFKSFLYHHYPVVDQLSNEEVSDCRMCLSQIQSVLVSNWRQRLPALSCSWPAFQSKIEMLCLTCDV